MKRLLSLGIVLATLLATASCGDIYIQGRPLEEIKPAFFKDKKDGDTDKEEEPDDYWEWTD